MKTLLLLALLGQIGVSETGTVEVEQHSPIVITSDYETPDGWQSLFDWEVEKPAKGREVDEGKTLHVWAPPGTYEIELEVIQINWDSRQIQKKQTVTTLKVLGGSPTPNPPGPGPGPGPSPPQPTPDDEFGISEPIKRWGSTLSEVSRSFAPAVAQNYRLLADRLEGKKEPFLTIGQLSDEARRLNGDTLGDPQIINEWRTLGPVVTAVWDPTWRADKVAKFMRVVAGSLESI